MRLLWIALVTVGCGGGGGEDSSTDGGSTSSPGGGGDGDVCDQVPSFAVDELGCTGLSEAWQDTVDAASPCEKANDCKAVRAQCEHWNGVGCWYATNDCFKDSEVAAFNSAAAGCFVATMQCTCQAAPDVDCVNGHCQFIYGSY